jgi:hypothetical protein
MTLSSAIQVSELRLEREDAQLQADELNGITRRPAGGDPGLSVDPGRS